MAADGSVALAVKQQVQDFLNAALTGNLDFFKKMAEKLDDGQGLSKTVADVKDANDRTALHFAAREGQTEVCKYLLEELKLDVNVKDADGETPLVHAARQGHIATVSYLLDHGADPAIASDLGATALHHAAGIGNIELMKVLLSKGAPVDSQSDSGTPLIWAAGHEQKEAVEVLLEHHANPNSETDEGITPLLSSVAAGSLECLEQLIQAGAKANISAGGTTPLHIASDLGSIDLINCLLKAGADPNATDEDGQKPVQVAATRGNRNAVEILLPLTTPVQSIPNWTIDGIIQYMQSETQKQEELARSFKELNSQKNTNLSRQDLPEVTPEAKQKAAEAKSRGHEAFNRKDYALATDAYTQAIDLDPSDATFYSNRSLCWFLQGQAEQALADAKACRSLRPNWAKAAYREGAALRLLERFEDAANAFYEGVQLDPENRELVTAFREAIEAGRKFHESNQAK
ncbi:ankyrin-1-like [Chenopodium quinoa]|uniref:Serine/threonine-protein kinase BSK1-like TPR repeats domain-containing protein n=1 Tax=Chenopodium quinoa TaxID=63459 RepID=A0A803KPU6_CHEQI|nr:ankyrin-1-like [Chenopodium quinoa]